MGISGMPGPVSTFFGRKDLVFIDGFSRDDQSGQFVHYRVLVIFANLGRVVLVCGFFLSGLLGAEWDFSTALVWIWGRVQGAASAWGKIWARLFRAGLVGRCGRRGIICGMW